MIKRNKTYDSFFKFVPSRPLFSSYGQFLMYMNKNNIPSRRKMRQKAIFLLYDNFNQK